MHNEQDKIHKKTFLNPVLFQHLIEGFLPSELTSNLDFSSLKNRSGHYLTTALDDKIEDIVWEVKFKSEPNSPDFTSLAGEAIYLCFLLEFQSSADKEMPLRILSYVAAFYEHFSKTENLDLTKDKLPLVFPFVLYTGQSKWKVATQLAKLLPPIPKLLEEYQGGRGYFLLSTQEISEELADDDTNLVKRYYALERATTPDEFEVQLQKLIELLKRTDTLGRYARSFSYLIKYHIRKRLKDPELAKQIDLISSTDTNYLREIEEMAEIYDQWEDILMQRGEERGRAEGIQIGMQNALRDIVLNLSSNFGLSSEKIAKGLKISLDTAKQLLNEKP